MIAIAVDDERPMLQALAQAVEASPDIRQLHTFSTCSSALEWMERNAANVAFLDISMRGMGGLAYAPFSTERIIYDLWRNHQLRG